MSAAPPGVNPNDLLAPELRASLPPDALASLELVLTSALHSVYVLFVGIAAVATVVAVFLPGGRPSEVSDAGPPLAA